MNEHLNSLREDLEALIEETELIQKSEHKNAERIFLRVRNFCVAIASVLFLLSFVLHGIHGLLRGIAYFLGAAAYFCELGALTDGFSHRVPHEELFMIYCFGPLYVLMGLAYLLE